MIFRARQFQFTFPHPALIMGVVNVTPDSFSDGGLFFDPTAAVDHGIQLVKEGADVLDIGGESTRPNAAPVTEQEELRRVIPVLEALASQVKVPLSIDTMKPAVARATAGFIVSIERGTFTWLARASSTGITRRNSSCSVTGAALGRVDSPPISRTSAPSLTN